MLNWINFLHFYQPPIISDEIIGEVVKSSYSSWVKFLNQHQKVKVTLNFSACLTERLFNSKHTAIISDLAKIAQRGQIEFVDSAAFHPILPLLPAKEIIKQIQINRDINSLRFGPIYSPQGFYLPEMAYSSKVAQILKDLGYKYILLDQIAFNGNLDKKIDNSVRYKIKKLDLDVVFRDRQISQTFVPETLINKLENNKFFKNESIITATDGELYGHRYWNWWPAYKYLTQKKLVQTLTISEYLDSLSVEQIIDPLKSSWESTQTELENSVPYALWWDPHNRIHQLLWRLAKFALKLNIKNEHDKNHYASRLHLEKGLASCTFWWASGRDFELFSPHAWDPKMVETGAHELLNSIRSLSQIKTVHKIKAEKLFSQIRELIWKKHWRKNGKV